MANSQEEMSEQVQINIGQAHKDDKSVKVVIVPENILQAITNSSNGDSDIAERFSSEYKLTTTSSDTSGNNFDVDPNSSEHLWFLLPSDSYSIGSETTENVDATSFAETSLHGSTVSCTVVNDIQHQVPSTSSEATQGDDLPLFHNCLLFPSADCTLLADSSPLPALSSPLKNVLDETLTASKTQMVSDPQSLMPPSRAESSTPVSQASTYAMMNNATKSNKLTNVVPELAVTDLLEHKSVDTADKATHTDDAKLVHECNVESCNLMFSSPQQLHKHTATVHGKEKVYKCKYANCPWSFSTPYKLKRHLGSHYKQKPFVCIHAGCGKSFSNSYNLTNHVKSHSQPHVICHICSVSTSGKRDLEMHMRKVHNEAPSFLCSICKQLFHTAQALTTHKKSHDPRKVEHSCPLCGKTYSKRSELKMHLYVHTGERPFQCDQCEWTFTSNSHLTRHKKVHEKKRYNCSVKNCPKQFHRLEHLAVHLQKSHVENGTNEGRSFHALFSLAAGKDAKLYHCDSCNLPFLSSHGLIKHKAVCEERLKCETFPTAPSQQKCASGSMSPQEAFIETSLVDNEVDVTSEYDFNGSSGQHVINSVSFDRVAKGPTEDCEDSATASLSAFANDVAAYSDNNPTPFMQMSANLSASSSGVGDDAQKSDLLQSYAVVTSGMNGLADMSSNMSMESQALKHTASNGSDQKHFLFEDDTTVSDSIGAVTHFPGTTINLSDLQ